MIQLMVLRSASTNLILNSTNTNKLMQLTKNVTKILSVYLKKYMTEIFIGRI